eukprot:1532155-Amphidinium_carterae.1
MPDRSRSSSLATVLPWVNQNIADADTVIVLEDWAQPVDQCELTLGYHTADARPWSYAATGPSPFDTVQSLEVSME